MKKTSLLILLSVLFASYTFAQTERVIGPAEKKMTDTVCDCLSKLDMSKVTNKAEANAAITNCITLHIDMFKNVVEERNVDFNDRQAMTKVGIDIGANMMKNGCEGFIKVSTILAQDEVDRKGETGTTSGVLKRIDNKGFNYFAITDINKSEKSFIWLREFPGSEKFTNGLGDYAGRKVKIKWDEIEVYLPAAKGYYKVKEIVELTLE